MKESAYNPQRESQSAAQSRYRSDIDMIAWARKDYGEDFADYMQQYHCSSDFVMRLATLAPSYFQCCVDGEGASWLVRVTLANLDDSGYDALWVSIRQVMCQYYAAFVVRGCA